MSTDTTARRLYQRYELDAYLGDYVGDYDADAIEDEATEINPRTGIRYWREDIDLDAIAAAHDLTA